MDSMIMDSSSFCDRFGKLETKIHDLQEKLHYVQRTACFDLHLITDKHDNLEVALRRIIHELRSFSKYNKKYMTVVEGLLLVCSDQISKSKFDKIRYYKHKMKFHKNEIDQTMEEVTFHPMDPIRLRNGTKYITEFGDVLKLLKRHLLHSLNASPSYSSASSSSFQLDSDSSSGDHQSPSSSYLTASNSSLVRLKIPKTTSQDEKQTSPVSTKETKECDKKSPQLKNYVREQYEPSITEFSDLQGRQQNVFDLQSEDQAQLSSSAKSNDSPVKVKSQERLPSRVPIRNQSPSNKRSNLPTKAPSSPSASSSLGEASLLPVAVHKAKIEVKPVSLGVSLQRAKEYSANLKLNTKSSIGADINTHTSNILGTPSEPRTVSFSRLSKLVSFNPRQALVQQQKSPWSLNLKKNLSLNGSHSSSSKSSMVRVSKGELTTESISNISALKMSPADLKSPECDNSTSSRLQQRDPIDSVNCYSGNLKRPRERQSKISCQSSDNVNNPATVTPSTVEMVDSKINWKPNEILQQSTMILSSQHNECDSIDTEGMTMSETHPAEISGTEWHNLDNASAKRNISNTQGMSCLKSSSKCTSDFCQQDSVSFVNEPSVQHSTSVHGSFVKNMNEETDITNVILQALETKSSAKKNPKNNFTNPNSSSLKCGHRSLFGTNHNDKASLVSTPGTQMSNIEQESLLRGFSAISQIEQLRKELPDVPSESIINMSDLPVSNISFLKDSSDFTNLHLCTPTPAARPSANERRVLSGPSTSKVNDSSISKHSPNSHKPSSSPTENRFVSSNHDLLSTSVKKMANSSPHLDAIQNQSSLSPPQPICLGPQTSLNTAEIFSNLTQDIAPTGHKQDNSNASVARPMKTPLKPALVRSPNSCHGFVSSAGRRAAIAQLSLKYLHPSTLTGNENSPCALDNLTPHKRKKIVRFQAPKLSPGPHYVQLPETPAEVETKSQFVKNLAKFDIMTLPSESDTSSSNTFRKTPLRDPGYIGCSYPHYTYDETKSSEAKKCLSLCESGMCMTKYKTISRNVAQSKFAFRRDIAVSKRMAGSDRFVWVDSSTKKIFWSASSDRKDPKSAELRAILEMKDAKTVIVIFGDKEVIRLEAKTETDHKNWMEALRYIAPGHFIPTMNVYHKPTLIQRWLAPAPIQPSVPEK
ncbi:hypothetical protein SJAG_00953 [Schizosaccharomyces japonicus yFS275]|uniref:Uncharacterized protein n=1 Tax=Schizosaccharomyces japonicus (strain yFS275 / FY16936) TaxID=402676 RepID=B6JX26_SCHJY|nr:hypothetical protein SJAG_00953 [Schizosaccharomyces japonicus yFS275]EEB05927.1 hypothetical protein SJAG_00953 [Schizosaccharomyces japonicus yFS275]